MEMSCLQRDQQMEKYDPFTYPEGIPPRIPGRVRRHGLLHFDCQPKVWYGGYPDSALVLLYAKLGIHRYNWLEATNFQVHSLKGFNIALNSGASPYYITLAACLPNSGLQQTFQVLVQEKCLGILDLTCPISRPQVTVTESSKEELPFLRRHCVPMSTIYNGRLPRWPSLEIDFSDTKRFYLVKESELQYNDWISLYVELAICTSNRKIKAPVLAKFDLVIVQVAIEALDDLKQPPRLDSKNVVFYIAYRDLTKARIGELCDCKAIIRRVFDEATGTLSIKGKYWSEEKHGLSYGKSSKKRKRAMKPAIRRRHRIWRFLRLRLGYKRENKCTSCSSSFISKSSIDVN